ncbi:Glycoside hydrolase family 76 protein [Mycena kentingensis (nom. inval.)]|nr:Glycoside hydrolase family 76 protein [Mycena kentingensis (nom. inval.)]
MTLLKRTLVATILPLAVGATCQKYLDAATRAASALQATYFDSGTGTYKDDQAVWISAVDTFYLLQLDSIAGTSTYASVIDTVFKGQEVYLETGESFDDVQWVSLAYGFAGDVENAKKYYDIATTAVESSYCGGGLFWSGKRDYKNAITNELYMATSGFLYELTQEEQYLDSLKTTWAWLESSKMVSDNGLFADGLTNDGTCAGTGTQWTYNQGVVLMGLAYLYKFTNDEQYLNAALDIAEAAISVLTTDNGLRESCESDTQMLCNADQQTFKGIIMFSMARFLSIGEADDGTKVAGFIKLQADKILANAIVPGQEDVPLYGSVWYASGESNASGSASSQASALGAFVAASQQSC